MCARMHLRGGMIELAAGGIDRADDLDRGKVPQTIPELH